MIASPAATARKRLRWPPASPTAPSKGAVSATRSSAPAVTITGELAFSAPYIEPMALPIARSELPSREALTETRISGADVASATTVSPISSAGTPRLRAAAAAP